MTIDQLYFLVAETRCAHKHLILEDAMRAADGDDWTAYLQDVAHPGAYRVHNYHAFQACAPVLPAAWLALQTRVERHGHDYAGDNGAITPSELAQILADALDGPTWRLHAIHRTAPVPASTAAAVYLVELVDATGEIRTAPSFAAYQHQRYMIEEGARPVDLLIIPAPIWP